MVKDCDLSVRSCHGGIGFTWEADPHLFFKRAKSNESLLGHPTYHRARLTRELGL